MIEFGNTEDLKRIAKLSTHMDQETSAVSQFDGSGKFCQVKMEYRLLGLTGGLTSSRITCVQLHTYTEHQGQKILVSDGNDSILIRVMVPECGRHRLQRDTQLDEGIEVNGVPSLPVELPHDDGVELVRQSVAE